MKKRFTFEFFGQRYNPNTKRWSNEYVILKDNEWHWYVGYYVTGYKNAVKECRRLNKLHQNSLR